jgi:hypothetical protein
MIAGLKEAANELAAGVVGISDEIVRDSHRKRDDQGKELIQ